VYGIYAGYTVLTTFKIEKWGKGVRKIMLTNL